MTIIICFAQKTLANTGLDETLAKSTFYYYINCMNNGSCSQYKAYNNKALAYYGSLKNQNQRAKSLYCQLKYMHLNYQAEYGVGDPVAGIYQFQKECD